MNEGLLGVFTKREVDLVLKQMAPLKAPSPDGMPLIFYQHYWSLIGDDVSLAVLSCLNSGTLLTSLNHTYIIVSKRKIPKRVTEFRLVALCNIIYKLILKVLANKLKSRLPFVISESQSAFQYDKAISDNILVAFETLHHMKNKKIGKEGYMAIKLDMSKTYDRIEWMFLERLMRKMGFLERWIGLMLMCVQSVTNFSLVNGEPRGFIHPTQGIYQGDPLSSYIFLLVSKGLNGLLQKVFAPGDTKGFFLCKNGPQIPHLFFADDSLIFCRAQMRDVVTIQAILT